MVYDFSEGRHDLSDLLGGKGASLAELTYLGIPTPPGFIITTEGCREFHAGDGSLSQGLLEEIEFHIRRLEEETNLELGNPERPLLVSVRSGAPKSMPGMMDTFINIGLTEEIALKFQQRYQNKEIAARMWKPLEQSFRKNGILSVPENPREQLYRAIRLVFNSWNNDRAIQYRRERYISDDLCTAAIVQKMVLGIGPNSGTGVFFTQDPVFGTAKPTGDWLSDAFGEELVDGRKKPQKITALISAYPEIYRELVQIGRKLETHFGYVQDIEYTVENGRVWILQCRNAILSLYATAKTAYNMVIHGDITRKEAIARIDVGQLDNIRNFVVFDQYAVKDAIDDGRLLGVGLNPSFGAVVGDVAIGPVKALQYLSEGRPVIMVSDHADTENLFRVMRQVNGILTQRGGATSHAALVARQLGKPCVVGCGAMSIDHDRRSIHFGEHVLAEGDTIALDAWTGNVYLGALPIVNAQQEPDNCIDIIEEWAHELSAPSVWASADYRYDAQPARALANTIRELWEKSPYQSDKARSAHIRSVIPDEHNIVMIPVPAQDENAVRQAILDAVENGFWAGVRTGLSPQPLGSSPWVMGLKNAEDVDGFMASTYKEWLSQDFTIGGGQKHTDGREIAETATLTELIVVSNPPYLGLKDHENEHFVFRLNCQNGIVTVEANLGTAQLRSIEKDVERSELIRIESKMDFRDVGRFFQPHAKVAFGAKYLRPAFINELEQVLPSVNTNLGMYYAITRLSSSEYIAYRLASIFPEIDPNDRELIMQRCTDLMETEDIPKSVQQDMIEHQAYNVIDGIVTHIFKYWWQPEVLDLPYMMWAFDIALGLHILEAQGRMNEEGEIEYIRIYDVRGREEKQEAERAKQTSYDLRH